MKKLTMFLFAALIATTAGATCIEFDNFCDRLQISVARQDDSVLWGAWKDWNCLGSDENALGSIHAGLGTYCAADVLGGDQPYCFQVTPTGGGTCTFDLYQHNGGGGPLTYHQVESPCTITPGSCPADDFARGEGVPSLLGSLD